MRLIPPSLRDFRAGKGGERSSKWSASFGLAPVMLAGLLFPTTAQAAARDVSEPDPEQTISWTPCFEDVTELTGQVFDCGQLVAPLDYDRPDGETITVEMVRVPAADQANKIGSVLLNPGGPGGSGIDFALGFGPFAGDFFGQEVSDRFDLIGFDPRGIGRSTPILCYNTFEDSLEDVAPIAFPVDRAEEALVYRSDAALSRNCQRRAEPIANHMSTANVARDMDSIRAAIGEDQLNFLGLSYGTFLGTTYANLFPDRVRAVAIDGVLDPTEWVNEPGDVPFSTAIRSDKGAQDTLESFFASCEAAVPGNCALAPGAEGRFDALATSLEESPIELTDPETGETFTITYSMVIQFVLGSLYDPFGYQDTALILADLETLTTPQTLPVDPAVAGRLKRSMQDQEFYSNLVEGFPAVSCLDTNNPNRRTAWSSAGIEAEEEFGYFGRSWTWASSTCARWPFADRDRYTGPFTAETANPVLIIGNRFDPATRYEAAQGVRALLPNSGLLTVEAAGHTSLGLNQCAGAITGQYLLDPATATAVDGSTCESEFNPFDLFVPAEIPPTDTPSDGEASPAEAAEVREMAELAPES